MKQLFLFYLSIGVILVTSCKEQGKTKNKLGDSSIPVNDTSSTLPKPVTVNSRLLNFKIDLITTIGDLSSRDKKRYDEIFSNELILSTDTVRYLDDKIYISCIKPAAGCADYRGDILFRNDTLILVLNNTSSKACTEMEEWRTVYEVENRGNRKYVIQKR